MKKILIITPMFPPPFTGGGCTHLLNLINELKKLPFQITIFTQDLTSRNNFKFVKKFIHPKILLYRFPTISLPRIQYKFISLRLIIEFLKIKPDIIHAHGYPFHGVGDLSIFLAHLFGIPIIYTIHAYPQISSFVQKIYHKLYHSSIGRFIFKNADRIIFVSKSLLNECKNFVDNLNKISVIPNGINIKELTENTNPSHFIHENKLENKIILFSIGRIDKLKGFQKVIEIFPKLKEKHDNLIYLIAGLDGGFKKELQKMIKNKNLINSVKFLGYVNHQTKKNAFAAADLVLIPSLYEPFGIVILEAMVFGKPIISTKRGGIKEILKHEINGILINPSDQFELYDQIDKLLKNKELRAKLGKEAKRSVQKYDWKNIIIRINEIYNKTLNPKR